MQRPRGIDVGSTGDAFKGVNVQKTPQPGDIAAKRERKPGSAAGWRGTALVARRDAPPQSEATDLSNVVPFARPRRHAAAAAFPLPAVAADERPAPHAAKTGVGRSLVLLAASLALHSILLAMAGQQPRPMASIGVESITVEITLGATAAAGVAPTPGEQEVQAVAPSEQQAQDKPEPEQSRVATAMPQEVPVATQDTAPDLHPQEQKPEPDTAVAETDASTPPVERTEEPRPPVQPLQKAPERKRLEAATDKKTEPKKQVAATPPTDAASGVGRGRSDNAANYNGTVAAHLARYKQYPAAARSAGAQGLATVSFSIDGSGRVTSSRLTSGSGNTAIDEEVAAMPRRASPFPAPADGRGRNFTVPVRFNLR